MMSARTAFPVLSLSLLLVGCLERTKPDPADTGAEGGGPGGTILEAAPPDIVVSTSTMDFSGSPLTVTTVQDLTITNSGDEDLLLLDLTLDGPGAFDLGSPGAIRLPASVSTTVSVSFLPTTIDELFGQLIISSNDPDAPELWVELVGSGAGQRISVDPELELGPVVLGCVDTGTVTVSNVGTDVVQLTGASVAAPFSVVTADFPLSLSPGAEASLEVSFSPVIDGPDALEELVIQTELGEEMVSLRGSILESVASEDAFVAGNATTDILFAVDRSPSMDDDVQNLRDALPAFAAELDARGADWRVSMTVDDDGCINGSDLFVDPSFSPSDARTAAMNMLVLGSMYGSNTERAFTLMEASLGRTGVGDCNEGMIRSSATLNLVGVSDEPEQSTAPYTSFVSSFQSLKSDPADVAMHAIGPVTSSCGASGPTRYEDAAAATGGSVYDICDDLETNLVRLARALVISESSTFALSSTPVAETLRVTVDGMRETAWSYEAATNEVVFDAGNLPPDGAEVRVGYVEDTCP